MRSNRAFVMLDLLLGISLVLILTGVFVHAIWQANQSARTLAEIRQCSYTEQSIIQGCFGGGNGGKVRLPSGFSIHKAPARQAPQGFRWVIVTHKMHGDVLRLYGLIPISIDLPGRREPRR